MTREADSTRTAVQTALLKVLDISPIDGADMEGADEVLDALLVCFYSQPWLINMARRQHSMYCHTVAGRTLYGRHEPGCSAVPRAVRVTAGIEEEA